METPPGLVGARTEEIMAAWLRRLEARKMIRPETPMYNAAYEAVVEVLSKHADE